MRQRNAMGAIKEEGEMKNLMKCLGLCLLVLSCSTNFVPSQGEDDQDFEEEEDSDVVEVDDGVAVDQLEMAEESLAETVVDGAVVEDQVGEDAADDVVGVDEAEEEGGEEEAVGDPDAAEEDDDEAEGDGREEEEAPTECWVDAGTGLMWQVSPPTDYVDWDAAMTYCNGLALCGHGDWRLPTVSELRSIVRGCPATETGGACGVTDECLASSCWSPGTCWTCREVAGCYVDANLTGSCDMYWSSSSWAEAETHAWGVNFGYAEVDLGLKGGFGWIRCVRDETG